MKTIVSSVFLSLVISCKSTSFQYTENPKIVQLLWYHTFKTHQASIFLSRAEPHLYTIMRLEALSKCLIQREWHHERGFAGHALPVKVEFAVDHRQDVDWVLDNKCVFSKFQLDFEQPGRTWYEDGLGLLNATPNLLHATHYQDITELTIHGINLVRCLLYGVDVGEVTLLNITRCLHLLFLYLNINEQNRLYFLSSNWGGGRRRNIQN